MHKFRAHSALMNGKAPNKPPQGIKAEALAQIVQVMADAEIQEKRNPALRLPRQAEHYSQLVGYFLAGKNSKDIAVSIQAHFQRLQKYRRQCLDLGRGRRRRALFEVSARLIECPAHARRSCSRLNSR